VTIQIDDAGYGDLLYGVVIGAYKVESDHFVYDIVDVKYWQNPLYVRNEFKKEAARIALNLIERLEPEQDEDIEICQGNILDIATEAISNIYGADVVKRCKIDNRAQDLVESAYLDEIRNLGYNPIEERTKKWVKNFWDMYNWLKEDPVRLKWAKSGWPRLKKYKLFQKFG
jgi:hypothetical protein